MPQVGELVTQHTHETLHSLAEALARIEYETSAPESGLQLPLPLGFSPLDDLLNGGLRPGELMVVGGAAGVGKTIFGLQLARNVALRQGVAGRQGAAMYVCYEHDQAHLTQRLLCLESAELGQGEDALTVARLSKLAAASGGSNGSSMGLIGLLRRDPRYATAVQALERYAEVSGDANPLHLDDAVAAAIGLSAPPVHGMKLLAAFEPMLRSWRDDLIIYSLAGKFVQPILRGDTIRLSGRVLRATEKEIFVRLMAYGAARAPGIIGEATLRPRAAT